MENDDLPKTAPDLCNVSLSLLPPGESVVGSSIAKQLLVPAAVEMRNSSTELLSSPRSIASSAASTSDALSDHFIGSNVFLSVIRALQEKQRSDGASEVTCNRTIAETLQADRTCSGFSINKDVNLRASTDVSLRPSSDVSMQLSGDAKLQSSRDKNIQPLRDLSSKWSRDVNIQPLKDTNLPSSGDPKGMSRNLAFQTFRDRFQPSRGAKTQPSKDVSLLMSGEGSNKSSRHTISQSSRDISMQAFQDKTPDVVHSSKRRKAALSDRDCGDSSDSSSRELFSGRTSAAQLSYDGARRHTDSPSSSCSSSLSAASSPGPNSAHSGDLHRLPKGPFDNNGDGAAGGVVSSSSGDDVFNWAHSLMYEPSSSKTTISGTSWSSKVPSEKNASTSRVGYPLPHLSPKSSPRRVSQNITPQKTPQESSIRLIHPESSPLRISPKSSLRIHPKSSPLRIPPESSPLRIPPESSPLRIPPESSPLRIPPESSPLRIPPESSPLRIPPESSPLRIPPESSPLRIPPESSPLRIPPRSSPLRIPPRSSPLRIPPESSPLRIPPESSPLRIPPESSPLRIPPESSSCMILSESSPRMILSESSPLRIPPESSSRLIPPESSSRLIPPESSSRLIPPESSSHLIPPGSSPRLVLQKSSCRTDLETCVPPQSTDALIAYESSSRQGVHESSRRVIPDCHNISSATQSPPTLLSVNNTIPATKLNFDPSSSDGLPSKFDQRNGRTSERYRIPSPEKSPSFTTRRTSSSARSTSSSPRNQPKGRSLEPGSPAQIDTTQLTVDEILQFIRVPKFSKHEANNDKLKDFLDPHEIGHMNHLIKCFSDAIFSVTFPENIVGKGGCSPLDILDLYSCSIIRLYHLSFKNLDFINLLPDDQLALLKNFALKGILCMAFFIFNEESNSWAYPTGLYHQKLLEVKVTDLNQLLPYNYLQRILAMNVISAKLGIDWPMGMLLIGAFFYCPIDVEIQDIEKIDKLRDRYMEILFKYFKWKHGSANASLCFPEMLKLMDAVLKQCSELEHLNLLLKEDEVKALEERIESLSASCLSDEHEEDVNESPVIGHFTDGVTFSKINECILSSVRKTVCHSLVRNGGLELRPCAAVPTASMYYSNLPLESEEAKSRREVEALLLQRILEKNRASSDQLMNSSSSLSCAASVKTEASYARPQEVNPLAIQRLLLNLARKDLDVESKQETALPFLFNQKTFVLPETSGSLHQSSLMTSVSPQQCRTHYSSATNSVLTSHPKPNDHLAEITVTRKSPPVPKTTYQTEDSHFSSAIDLSKRPRLSSTISATSVRMNTPSVPALKPLTNFHALSRSSSSSMSSSPSTESPMNLGLEKTRLVALFNEIKKVGACKTEDVSHDTGDFPSSPILTSSQIEVLLETLGRSRIRYRSTDP